MKGYRQFLTEDGSFEREAFVASLSLSSRSAAYIESVLHTQLFDCFLRERHELPDDPEVRFFDESIHAKVNRSRKAAIASLGRGHRRDTSFIDDTSKEVCF